MVLNKELTTPLNIGRRRAVDRVREKLKRESRQWSPSGKRRMVPSRTIRTKPCPPRKIHSAPWDDRFIFQKDESTQPPECHTNEEGSIHARQIEKALGRGRGSKQPPKGMELNTPEDESQKSSLDYVNATETESDPIKTYSRARWRHYTERSDGEAVCDFQRNEVLPYDVDAGTYSAFTGTRSVGISPFDISKVRAALEDEKNRKGCDEERGSFGSEGRFWLHGHYTPRSLHSDGDFRNICIKQQNNACLAEEEQRACGNNAEKINSQNHQHRCLQTDKNENTVELMFDKFEELLFTSELEEQILQRELCESQVLHPAPTGVSLERYQKTRENSTSCILSSVHRRNASLTNERKSFILQYIYHCKSCKKAREKSITKGGPWQYHEIVCILVELILDSCIKNISREIENTVSESAQEIFNRL